MTKPPHQGCWCSGGLEGLQGPRWGPVSLSVSSGKCGRWKVTTDARDHPKEDLIILISET